MIEPGLGLHDYVARHYAQPLGRWIAPDTVVPDPMDPQSLNRHSYVGNRPTLLRPEIWPHRPLNGWCSLDQEIKGGGSARP